ncbi:hypothetical protein SCP_1600380 [Sparassis crispa]|uniref:ER membrane protein complex subunit 1 n=1 Tax=Sparassis crispa TaxID=139825 RepID=A0A401H4L8_9APHY|nr:hypothetical protein SCP_1600380 [Sparassis crispa]GBE89377.1 hypothetical protein SCP_1600380 [Sparassis crispa]
MLTSFQTFEFMQGRTSVQAGIVLDLRDQQTGVPLWSLPCSVSMRKDIIVACENHQVAQTRRIITSPAPLESTSLVFAYRLDLSFTRVVPSSSFDVLSENFNKAQLVFAVGGVSLAIVIAKPMASGKRLRERWYD